MCCRLIVFVVSFYKMMMEKHNLEIDKSTPNLTIKIIRKRVQYLKIDNSHNSYMYSVFNVLGTIRRAIHGFHHLILTTFL